MDKWLKIKNEWETTKITLVALAKKHDVKLGTLKSRKSREGWSRDPTKKDATNTRKVATPTKRMQPKKEGASARKKVVEPVEVIEFENDELTDKQRLFCIYYVKYFNATKAYQKAYGVDRNTAESIAYRLMGNDGVKSEIQRLKQQRMNDAYFDKYDVLQKYKDIAFADITDYMRFGRMEEIVKNEDGEPELDMNGNIKTETVNYIHLNDSTEIDGTILTEVKEGRDGITVKLADKMRALDFLAKYTDLLDEGEIKRLKEEKAKADIAKVRSETKGVGKEKINVVDLSQLSTEELRAIANSNKRTD